VLRDCVKACDPWEMSVRGEFEPRGGVYSTISASFIRKKARK
jgi:NADPH-dependent 7-cyano-7-deazaguanine reductase QueF